MKKIIYTTVAIVALSFASNAQTETKKETATSKPNGQQTKPMSIAPDGTAKSETAPAKTEKTEEPKKSGTRMAINEKGLPGDKKAKKTEKTEKTEGTTATPK